MIHIIVVCARASSQPRIYPCLPFHVSVQRKHCTVEVKKAAEKGEKGTVTLIGGRGEVLHNGRRVRKQEQVSGCQTVILASNTAFSASSLCFEQHVTHSLFALRSACFHRALPPG